MAKEWFGVTVDSSPRRILGVRWRELRARRDRQAASFREISEVHSKLLLTPTGKHFAERPVDMLNAFFDQLRCVAFRLAGYEHKGLKGIANVVIHEFDHSKTFDEPAHSVALVQIKQASGDQAAQQVVGDALRSTEPAANGYLIGGNQQPGDQGK